ALGSGLLAEGPAACSSPALAGGHCRIGEGFLRTTRRGPDRIPTGIRASGIFLVVGTAAAGSTDLAARQRHGLEDFLPLERGLAVGLLRRRFLFGLSCFLRVHPNYSIYPQDYCLDPRSQLTTVGPTASA